MPFSSAQEAFDEFQRTGNYANSDKHFANPEDFGAYKHMIPKETKKAFRAKVQGNENRAIEGLQQGLTREQMGIYDIPEQGRALYRRLGAGLGTGLDMSKSYNWNGGDALEVGTSDVSKRYKETRPITSVEQERWNALQAAGSPEAFWRANRQNQIQGLLSAGAIQRDPRGGYFNPGQPNQRYGANLEGYNLGQNPMGQGRGGSGYTPETIQSGSPMAYQAGSYGSPYGGGGGGFSIPDSPMTGGSPNMNPAWQSFGGGGGGLVSGGPPAPQTPGLSTYAPPPTPGLPFFPQPSAGGGGGTIQELPPGHSGIPSGLGGTSPFGSNPVPLPSGNGLVFGPGGGGAGGGGGTGAPPLPPIDLPPGMTPGAPGLPSWMTPYFDLSQPYSQGLLEQGGLDLGSQQFALDRARTEYMGALPYEDYLGGLYGDILGYDFSTGQPLQGDAALGAQRRSWSMLAPEVERLAQDADAALLRLNSEIPMGGQGDLARGEILSQAQQGIGGLRQGLMNQAIGGVEGLMTGKKGFDPMGYSGGNQALLEGMLTGRGQDLSSYTTQRGDNLDYLLEQRGQDIEALLEQRGQDVTWGTGWGQIGAGQMANMWDAYLRGRGQDMDLYSTLRGQDFQRQIGMEQARASRPSWWQSLLGMGGQLGAAYLGRP